MTPVNDAPVAVNDGYTTDEDTPLVTTRRACCANDSDVDGNPLTARAGDGPRTALTLNANGSFTYTPAANYNGTDTFTYKANDGSPTSQHGDRHHHGHPVNDAPVAQPTATAPTKTRH